MQHIIVKRDRKLRIAMKLAGAISNWHHDFSSFAIQNCFQDAGDFKYRAIVHFFSIFAERR